MKKPYIHRKDSVVVTAVEILHELGIVGLTSKEIAKRQQISEGTLFSHFKNMNEILLAVLEYYSELDASIMESVTVKKLEPVEAIRYFITTYAEYYENYPEITSLNSVSDLCMGTGELVEKANSIAETRMEYIRMLIEKAQLSGTISKDVRSEILTDLIYGSFKNIVSLWRRKSFSFTLKERILDTLQAVLNAYKQ